MKISVIVPCYNECGNIRNLYDRINRSLAAVKHAGHEIIFINDGSRDNTLELLGGISKSDGQVKIIDFSRNFGHEAATSAGIEHACGDAAFIIDADLQDPPELFGEMLSIMEKENCNVVYGVRRKREGEPFFKKLTSKIFYRILNLMSETKMPVDTGDFRLIDKKVIEHYKKFSEKNKYVRGLISWMGFKQFPVYYERNPRLAGASNYSYKKLSAFAFNIIFYFSKKPLHLSINLGFLCITMALLLTVYAVSGLYIRPTPGWVSTLIIIIFFGGVQLFMLGIIGEYIGILFDEVKNRPQYIINELINFD